MPTNNELSKNVNNSNVQAPLFADETAIVLTKESTENQIKSYFQAILALSKTDKPFPVNLDDVWGISYSAKEKAVRALKASGLFVENIDYRILAQNGENSGRGRKQVVYMLSIPCLEYFIARKVRPVFEVYRKVFHKVTGKKERMYPESEVKRHLLDAEKQVREACEASLRLQMENHDLRAKANAYRHILDEESERILKMLIFIERNKLTEKLKAYLAV